MTRQAPLALVLVAYDAQRTLQSLAFVRRLGGLIQVDSPRVLVLNHPSLALNADIKRLAKGWHLMTGTNEQHEISGWQEGLDFLMAQVDGSMSVLFLNDTVASHRHFSLFRLMALKRLIYLSEGAQLVGFVDRAPPGMFFSINGLTFYGWVSTYCFLLTSEALNRLGHTIWDKAPLAVNVNGGLKEEGFFGEKVSPDLRRHLCRWLFARGWYAAAALSPDNHDRMVSKAKSIIAEQWLTARSLAVGVEVVDPFDHAPRLCMADHRMVKYLGVLKRWRRST